MKLTLIEEKKQPLLARKDMVYTVSFPQTSTPSKVELKKAVVAAAKTKEDLVVLQTVRTQFGSTTAKIEAAVYDTVEALQRYGVVHKKKSKAKEGEPKAPEQTVAPKEEVPKKDVPKEEAKPVEEKKEVVEEKKE